MGGFSPKIIFHNEIKIFSEKSANFVRKVYMLLNNKLSNLSRAEIFRIVDIEINALSHLLIILKINQSEGRLEKPKQPIISQEVSKLWRVIND